MERNEAMTLNEGTRIRCERKRCVAADEESLPEHFPECWSGEVVRVSGTGMVYARDESGMARVVHPDECRCISPETSGDASESCLQADANAV